MSDSVDYFIEFESLPEVTEMLAESLKCLSSNMMLSSSPNPAPDHSRPWFPRHISDLRRGCTAVFKYGDELTADHPGYGDEDYVQRRKVIAQLSKNYQ